MLYLFVTLPFVLFAWAIYSSRDILLTVGRWILRRRYDVVVEGDVSFDPRRTYLVVPNHPAIVDPLLLVPELHHMGLDICPLVDESFFSNPLVRHVLALFNAVRVPDFRKVNFRPILKARPEYRSSARRAKALGYTILALLTSGESVLLYPSGHISPDGRESLGNRQLGYFAISHLPEGVTVVGVRMRGIFGSMWSRAGGVQAPPFLKTLVKSVLLWPIYLFKKRRRVSIHLEDITQQTVEWSKMTRCEFDRELERWYDADLAKKGLSAEIPT